jgi:prevent-host-death family protein
MQTVSMFQAKTTLSKLVEAVESGREKEIIISRHGMSVAKIVSITRQPLQQRIGVAKGLFVVPDTIDESNELIACMFAGIRHETAA